MFGESTTRWADDGELLGGGEQGPRRLEREARGNERANSNHDTQGKAIAAAHPVVVNSGGSELVVQDRHGQIRQKDTNDKPDPDPPAG